MIKFIKNIKDGVLEVLFPAICIVCGLKLTGNENFVCTRCLNDKFEEANPKGRRTSGDILLPEGIFIQHALWTFDKGGYLQELLHNLKYNRITGVGIDLGRQLGKSLSANPWFAEKVLAENAVLIPVPLHPRKKRSRGYNQAYYIAKGVADVTNISIIKKEVIQRIKNTQTQTGFTLEKRKKNIEKAFRVTDDEILQDKTCVIIDDVFTTGATTFELAGELIKSGCGKIIIATVAQA